MYGIRMENKQKNNQPFILLFITQMEELIIGIICSAITEGAKKF
jgi:hypothetical protein